MPGSAPGKQKPLVIVYHAPCLDGAASAWIIAKSRGVEDIKNNPHVTYIPFDHTNKTGSESDIRAALTPDSEIYFADITPEKTLLEELVASGRTVHVLDHHKSATERIAGIGSAPNLHVHFDDEAPSATQLACKALLPSEQAPPLIDLIDKMDGAAAGLKTPHDFAAAALVDSHSLQPMERAFDTLRGLAKLSFNEMAGKGGGIVADQNIRIDGLLENPLQVQLQLLPDSAPVRVPIVNADARHYGRQFSKRLIEAGRKSGANVAFAWVLQKSGSVFMSIRTTHDIDASRIAAHLCKTMGLTGGGHKDAAAVTFPSLSDFSRLMPIEAVKTPAVKPAPPSPG